MKAMEDKIELELVLDFPNKELLTAHVQAVAEKASRQLREFGRTDKQIRTILARDFRDRCGWFVGLDNWIEENLFPEGEDLYRMVPSKDFPPACEACRLASKMIAPLEVWDKLGYPSQEKLKVPFKCRSEFCRCRLEAIGYGLKKSGILVPHEGSRK